MRFRAPVACAVVAIVAAATARATVVLRCTVEDLTDLCHGAVLAKVTAKSVEDERAAGRIWTNYRLRIDETWFGAAAQELTVSVPGGESGGLTLEFQGGATFETGDRAAVFLWKRDDGRFLVLGEAQGAFRVRRDAATGADVCENSIDGLVFLDRAGKRVDAAPTKLTLDDLRAQVRDAKSRREERERLAREESERRAAARRAREKAHADLARGRPGAPPE